MAIKKTGSPLGGGAEPIEPLGGKDVGRGGKIDKKFETALSEVAGQIEQAASGEKSDGATRLAFRQIASRRLR